MLLMRLMSGSIGPCGFACAFSGGDMYSKKSLLRSFLDLGVRCRAPKSRFSTCLCFDSWGEMVLLKSGGYLKKAPLRALVQNLASRDMARLSGQRVACK